MKAIERNILPLLEQRGFQRWPLTIAEQKDRSCLRDSPFGYYKRKVGKNLEMIEIQLDNRARPKFLFNVGVIPPAGYKGHRQDDCSVGQGMEAFRLYKNGGLGWFGPKFWIVPFFMGRRIEAATRQAARELEQVLHWFETGEQGDKMKCFGSLVRKKYKGSRR